MVAPRPEPSKPSPKLMAQGWRVKREGMPVFRPYDTLRNPPRNLAAKWRGAIRSRRRTLFPEERYITI